MEDKNAYYECPSCGADKTIVYNSKLKNITSNFPDKVICGVRDCLDYAVRVVSLTDVS